MTIDVNTPLSDLVTADPRRTRVLERFGLDCCCHAQRPLSEAVGDARLNLAEVAAALDIAGFPAGKVPPFDRVENRPRRAVEGVLFDQQEFAHAPGYPLAPRRAGRAARAPFSTALFRSAKAERYTLARNRTTSSAATGFTEYQR